MNFKIPFEDLGAREAMQRRSAGNDGGRRGGNLIHAILVVAAVFGSVNAVAQLRVVPGVTTQSFTGGKSNEIQVQFHNVSGIPAQIDGNVMIYQASSATIAMAGAVQPWKKIEVLPGQTIVESVPLSFPVVRGKTRFIVQWRDQTNVIGSTDVFIFPTNILKDLALLVNNESLGIFDPQNELKPLLKKLKVEFDDLENLGVAGYAGKLALIGPFSPLTAGDIDRASAREIKTLASKGVAVVWIHNNAQKDDRLLPSFYPVLDKQSAIVIARSELVANLADRPESQINLVKLCQYALNPQPLAFPESTAESDALK